MFGGGWFALPVAILAQEPGTGRAQTFDFPHPPTHEEAERQPCGLEGLDL